MEPPGPIPKYACPAPSPSATFVAAGAGASARRAVRQFLNRVMEGRHVRPEPVFAVPVDADPRFRPGAADRGKSSRLRSLDARAVRMRKRARRLCSDAVQREPGRLDLADRQQIARPGKAAPDRLPASTSRG